MSIINNQVTIYTPQTVENPEPENKRTTLPAIFKTAIRDDLIQFAFKNMRMNKRQPYAVSPTAGKRHSARSLGTGRALARVPRINASGTRRSGQAAEANFARGGHMACPTTVQRKWKRMTPLSIRRITTAMGIAASAIPSMIEARGHLISKIEQIPLVVSDSVSEIVKTADALNFCHTLGLKDELEKVKDSRAVRCGRGKLRNRRFVEKTGALLIHNFKEGDSKLRAFLNIKGIQITSVTNLSVLSLCPGGFAGRLIIWTEGAFEELNNIKIETSEVVESINSVESMFYSQEVQAFLDEPNLLETPEVIRGTGSLLKMNKHFDKY
ncbi:60S ribosomal protein L4 [Cucumispora dikerogammari]|nr:60S ribosomal protein L4 [Cucumispora dikerogammari]